MGKGGESGKVAFQESLTKVGWLGWPPTLSSPPVARAFFYSSCKVSRPSLKLRFKFLRDEPFPLLLATVLFWSVSPCAQATLVTGYTVVGWVFFSTKHLFGTKRVPAQHKRE